MKERGIQMNIQKDLFCILFLGTMDKCVQMQTLSFADRAIFSYYYQRINATILLCQESAEHTILLKLHCGRGPLVLCILTLSLGVACRP